VKLYDLVERNGKLSHTKTAYIIGVLVSSWVIIHMTLHNTITADMLLYYIGATVFGSLGSKATDAYAKTGSFSPKPDEKVDEWK